MNDEHPVTEEVTCLVVGAGIAGLMAARELRRKGVEVIILDKSRGVGGRRASRRFAGGVFDHGTQYFAPSSPWFQTRIAEWLDDGIAREWFRVRSFEMDPRFLSASRYCGSPVMTEIPKQLAGDIDVRTSERASTLSREEDSWALTTDSGSRYIARSVILTAPVPQSLALIDSIGIELSGEQREVLENIEYEPCLTMLGVCEGAPELPDGGVLEFERGNLRRIMDNATKGVSPVPALTVHAMGDFSRKHFDDTEDEILASMKEETETVVGTSIREAQLHRWRYSQVVQPHHAPMLVIDSDRPLIVAGDGFGVNGVEGAARSGMQAALAVMRQLV